MRSGHENNIPFSAPSMRFQEFNPKISEIFQSFSNKGQLILGSGVENFEQAFARYIGVKHCVAVNSCTDAITLSLKAIGLQAEDEVITAGLTAPATVIGILNAGATPVIVDVSNPTLTIDPNKILEAITSKTKAILPVHLHGYSCDMATIKEIADSKKLLIIEDCAQSHGGTYKDQKLGSIGDFGVFSFYPTKNLGCMGDGGAITTNSDDAAEKLRSLRNYGFNEGIIEETGMNSRLDEIQAAILNHLLPYLDEYNAKRRYWADQYHQALVDFKSVLPPMADGAVFHQFAINVSHRDELREALYAQGLNTGIHYKHTIEDHPSLKKYCTNLEVAKTASNRLLSLPIQPEILEKHFNKTVAILTKSLRKHLMN